MRRSKVLGLMGAALLGSGLVSPEPASAAPAGPDYSVPVATLDAALTCDGDLTAGPTPVLFIPGTTLTPATDWAWSWNRELHRRGWAYCNVELPDSALADIQVSAEYVTYAIRTMHERAGRQISMVGHSQGGMIGRWSFKFWPDTRAMVDDYVGLSPSNHGSVDANVLCKLPGVCQPALHQQARGSAFMTALNDGTETYPEVDYTNITATVDEVVVPATSGHLTPGPNVTNTSVSKACPLEVVEHLGMSGDNAAWLIGLDALEHDGPAVLSRVDRSTCGRPFMPGVRLGTVALDLTRLGLQVARALATEPRSRFEPPLMPYAR